jgi:hypothetical protein
LLVRVTLPVKEVLVRSLKPLLLQTLHLLTCRHLGLVDTLLLSKLLLTQIAEHACRSQLLLDTLKTKVLPKLPRLLTKLRPKLTLSKGLLLRLKLRLLVSQLSL